MSGPHFFPTKFARFCSAFQRLNLCHSQSTAPESRLRFTCRVHTRPRHRNISPVWHLLVHNESPCGRTCWCSMYVASFALLNETYKDLGTSERLASEPSA
ncbi:hypothetical protein BDV98DRAFT_403676 [Pterulicium gracile]|uniref:Uncharacterized protein n=1 Tax=Pterulicium gracile TaxID=1884261 RepID=A0A5C3QR60_9AGAR|nr:hypothetical protein BDV98DRAFT_403676 [Pterula gracilis]